MSEVLQQPAQEMEQPVLTTEQSVPVTEHSSSPEGTTSAKLGFKEYQKALIIAGVVVLIAVLAAVGYQLYYSKNEQAILDKISTALAQQELSAKEVVDLTNKNAAVESLKDIKAVETFFQAVIGNDQRIIEALAKQETELSQQSQLISNIKTPEIKKNTGLYIDQLQKYIKYTRQEYIKIKTADEQYAALLKSIKQGKLNGKDADTKIAEITSNIQNGIKNIENYDSMELKRSYLDFTTSLQAHYPELRNKYPKETLVFSGLLINADSLQRIKTGLMPSDNEIIDAVKTAEELVNKVIKETKPVKRTFTTYDYWGEPIISDYYLSVPPSYAKTPELLTKFLRPKWSKEEADEFANQLSFDTEANLYHFPSLSNKTFVANASSVNVEEKAINYGKIRVVPQKVGSTSDYDEWLIYTNFIDYTVQKDTEGWKVIKMDFK